MSIRDSHKAVYYFVFCEPIPVVFTSHALSPFLIALLSPEHASRLLFDFWRDT